MEVITILSRLIPVNDFQSETSRYHTHTDTGSLEPRLRNLRLNISKTTQLQLFNNGSSQNVTYVLRHTDHKVFHCG